jgi:hypothetical protein
MYGVRKSDNELVALSMLRPSHCDPSKCSPTVTLDANNGRHKSAERGRQPCNYIFSWHGISYCTFRVPASRPDFLANETLMYETSEMKGTTESSNGQRQ